MGKRRSEARLTARTADVHTLYEAAVQCPEAEVGFVSRQFQRLRGRPARTLREDFCGTGAVAAEWVRSHGQRRAVGLDLDGPTLAEGQRRHIDPLGAEQRSRVRLVRADVLRPPRIAAPGSGVGRGVWGGWRGFDVVCAFNFSYWVFGDRATLRRYFEAARRALAPDGVMALDLFGGSDSMLVQQERRRCRGFTYVWDQRSYDPASGAYDCRIHFEFKDGTRLRDAFCYRWRLWTAPEVREVLSEAGFARVRLYAEGDDGRGGGNGIYREVERFDPDRSFVAYLVAER